MRLADLLNNIAYLYLTDVEFQPVAGLSGVDWFALPPFDSVKAIRKYLDLRGSNPHAVALFELKDEIRLIEMNGLDLGNIGDDEEEIGHQLKKSLTAYRYEQLAKQILQSPEKAEMLFKQFDSTRISPVSVKSVSDFLPNAHHEFLIKQLEGKSKVVVPGFKELSDAIGGFNPGRVIMVLGETGFGKTNLAMNLAVNAATKFKCLFINMEMPLEDISRRLAVLTTGKTFAQLEAGFVTLHDVSKDLPVYGDNLKFTEGYSLSIQSIEALMRREHANGLDFVVIDYDQKITFPFSKGIPEWQQLRDAVTHIEDVAKELRVHVIMLAQLNREGAISSSHRAKFGAHTIVNFKGNDSGSAFDKQANALIHIEKSRHGKKDHAVLVHYNDDNLQIKEVQLVKYKPTENKNGQKTLS